MTSRFNNFSIDPPIPAPEDSDEQLVIGDERAFIELQESSYVKELGVYAVEMAAVWLNIAYECRDTLVDWGEIEKSRKKPVDVRAALPELSTEAEG